MEKIIDNESKDRRLKYIEMPGIFYTRASETRIACRQQMLACERIGKFLARKSSRNPKEFEQDEYMKDFVIKTLDAAERTLGLLEYTHAFLQDVANDAMVLIDGAKIQDQLQDQSDTIETLIATRETLIKDLYDLKRTTGATK